MGEKVGVIIARLQPIHNGHLELIRQALNENDKVLVLVGSADKLNKRNPIPINMRLDMAIEAIYETFNEVKERIVVEPLDDLTDESDNSHDWGFYLYSKIVGITRSPEFTIYYSDGFEIIMLWFPPFITRNYVSFKLNARGTIAENISDEVLVLNAKYEKLSEQIKTSRIVRALNGEQVDRYEIN